MLLAVCVCVCVCVCMPACERERERERRDEKTSLSAYTVPVGLRSTPGWALGECTYVGVWM